MAFLATITVGPGGDAIGILLTDTSTGQPAAVTAVGTVPTVSVNGTPIALLIVSGSPAVVWGVNGSKLLPYIIIFPASAIASGSVVTLDAPAGWATMATGSAPALVAAVADMADRPDGGTTLSEILAAPKSMLLGYNVDALTANSPILQTANAALRCSSGWSGFSGTGTVVVDSSNNLVSFAGFLAATSDVIGTVNYATTPDNARGLPTAEPGIWTLKFRDKYTSLTLYHANGAGALASNAAIPADVPYTNGHGVTVVGPNATGGGIRLASAGNTLHPGGAAAGSVGTTPFEIVFWYRVPAGDTNLYLALDKMQRATVSNGLSTAKEFSAQVNAGKPLFVAGTNSSGVTVQQAWSHTAPPTAVWHMASAYFTGSAIGLTVDGVDNGTTTACSGVFSGTSPLQVAANFGTAVAGRCDLDSIGVFNQVLTPTQRTALLNGGIAVHSDALAGLGLGLVSGGGPCLRYWDFDEASGSRAEFSGTDPLVPTNGDFAQCVGAEPVPITDNVATFTIPAPSAGADFSPRIRLYATAPLSNCASIRVYPPGVPTDDSVSWLPQTIRHLGRPSVLRYSQMSVVAANEKNNCLVLEDYMGGFTGLGVTGGVTARTVAIASIQAPAGGSRPSFAIFTNYGRFQINCSSPHGLVDGQRIRIQTLAGGPNGNGTVAMVGGTNFTLANQVGVVAVVDSTTLLFTCFVSSPTAPAVSGLQTITGTALTRTGGVAPLPMFLDLCDAVGAAPWITLDYLTPPSEVARTMNLVGPRLTNGRKLYLERSNEHWNTSGVYFQSAWYQGIGGETGLGASGAYAADATGMHDAAFAALDALGLGDRLVRVYGTQTGNTTLVLKPILDYCNNNNKLVDLVAGSIYWHCGPNEPSLKTTYDALSINQLFTCLEYFVRFGQSYKSDCPTGLVALNYAAIAAYPRYAGVTKVGLYESAGEYFGWTSNSSSTVSTRVDGLLQAELSTRMQRSPRMGALARYALQQYQSEGAAVCNYFALSTTNSTVSGFIGNSSTWPAYYGINQDPGLGDGSDGRFDNRTSFDDFSSLVSVVGLANEWWMGLSNAAAGNLTVTAGAPPAPGAAATITVTRPSAAAAATISLHPTTPGVVAPLAQALAAGVASTTFTWTPAATTPRPGILVAKSSDGTLWGASAPHAISPANSYYARRRRA